MVSASEFLHRVAELQDELRLVVDQGDSKMIEKTAVKLEGLNYAPTVIVPVGQFLRMRKVDLLARIEELILLNDEEVYELAPGDSRSSSDLTLQFIAVPEAWDGVDELYVHDAAGWFFLPKIPALA